MFKLVRIDDDNHHEIQLSDGKQIIGRGQFPECEDKRISRNHAEIEVADDSIIFKAIHTNPCFFINNQMTDVQVIYSNKQQCIVKACHGDKIGFLPDEHWYEVTNKKDTNDTKQIAIRNFQPLKDIIQRCILSSNTILKLSENDKEHGKEADATENTKTDKPESNESDETAASSLILHKDNEYSAQADDGNISQSPGKRCLLKQEPASPIDIKKVKTDENALSSGSLASTSGASSANSNSSPPREQNRKRERCMYGDKCFRKNLQHKAQFSHPGDTDWGVGNQAPCPWGYACARRDPRHWRDHTHPYGMHPPPPSGMQKRKTHIVQRNGKIFYINAHAVNFYDDHFDAEDSDGGSVDYDYEFN